jgi:hypothetical protein
MSAAVTRVKVLCIIIFLILSRWKISPTNEKTTHFVFTTKKHGANFTPVYCSFLYLNTSPITLYCSCLKAWIKGLDDKEIESGLGQENILSSYTSRPALGSQAARP